MRRIAIAVGVMASILVTTNASSGEVKEILLHGQIQESPAPDTSCIPGKSFQSVGALEGAPTGPVNWTGGSCVHLIIQPGNVTVHGSFSLDDGLLAGTYEATGGPTTHIGHVEVTGTFRILFSSGVYEGATGSGTFRADLDLLTRITDVALIGSLELAG